MSFFSVKNLSAGYDRGLVIENISFDLEAGSLMGVLGANGSGKSTLLKAICGNLPHDGMCALGDTVFERLSARKIARLCSYIPQRSGISIDISALDVVLMGFNPRLGILERPDESMRDAARKALTQVGLAEKAHENYLHLSEGQKQLCIMARTLVSGSSLLLLDEPESALDFRHRDRVLSLLQKWVREKNIGAIITLHDPALALNYCDRLLILSDGHCPGSISPHEDSPAVMESALSQLYGPVSLHTAKTRSGHTRLIMLKEDEQ